MHIYIHISFKKNTKLNINTNLRLTSAYRFVFLHKQFTLDGSLFSPVLLLSKLIQRRRDFTHDITVPEGFNSGRGYHQSPQECIEWAENFKHSNVKDLIICFSNY